MSGNDSYVIDRASGCCSMHSLRYAVCMGRTLRVLSATQGDHAVIRSRIRNTAFFFYSLPIIGDEA